MPDVGQRTTAVSIWKFPFLVNDEIEIEMPRGAEILHVAAQRDVPCLWARVTTAPDWPREVRRFALLGTGHPALDDGSEYVGTFMLLGGDLVFHLFERADG